MDDPIVFPNQPGASHSHDFFGNTTTSATSTQESMLQGSTTCSVIKDTAGYWSPSGYVNGRIITPLRGRAYYVGDRNTSVETIPGGLQMIAGNKGATSASENLHVSWFCGAETPISSHPYNCRPYAGLNSSVDGVIGRVDFPVCWDGTGLGQTDVAYADKGVCPADYSHLIPHLNFRVHFGIWDPCLGAKPCSSTNAPEKNIKLTLASGPYYTLHADFWNTWNQPHLDDLVVKCLNAHILCGVDVASPVPRNVSLQLQGHLVATGTVTDDEPFIPCTQGVAVTIQRKVSGRWQGFVRTWTRTDGSYEVRLGDRAGRYRAKATKTTVTTSGNTCMRATSAIRVHRH